MQMHSLCYAKSLFECLYGHFILPSVMNHFKGSSLGGKEDRKQGCTIGLKMGCLICEIAMLIRKPNCVNCEIAKIAILATFAIFENNELRNFE